MKRDIIYILIILILFIGGVLMFNKINNINKKFDLYENTINALNDSITKTIDDKFITYSQKSPEIDIKNLTNSEFFKTLSKEQQEFYNELKNIKGLISSTNAELYKQGYMIDNILAKDNGGIINDNKITFDKGKILSFNEKDTTKYLQYNAEVKLDSVIDFKLNYDYKFNIQTNFERQKDKSILVKYKIDDPELSVTKMHNFIIPSEHKTPFAKWFNKNRKTINIIGGAVLVTGGGIAGYGLAGGFK